MEDLSKETKEWILEITSENWLFTTPTLTNKILEDLSKIKKPESIIAYRCIGLFKGEKVFDLGDSEKWPNLFDIKTYNPKNITFWSKSLDFAKKWSKNCDYYIIFEAELFSDQILLDTKNIDSSLLSFGHNEDEILANAGTFAVKIVDINY